MSPEGGKLLGPQLFCLLQPGFQISHGSGPQAVDANASIEFGVGLLDQPARLQRAQVPAEGRRVEPDGFRQLACPPGLFPQQLDDLAPMRIGECRQGAVETDSRF